MLHILYNLQTLKEAYKTRLICAKISTSELVVVSTLLGKLIQN